MDGWGRWLIVAVLCGGLGYVGAPWPAILAAVLFAAAAFMEVDVVRLKRQASHLQSRLASLEDEVEVLRMRRPGPTQGASGVTAPQRPRDHARSP